MDDTLRSLYQNRIIDLERRQRDIRARRYQERKAGKLDVRMGRTLAFAYYLAHKEETRAREKLGYTAPRPLPKWVTMHTEHTLLEYIAFGGTSAEFVDQRLDGRSMWGHN
jgi:hypothetical protein